MVKLMTMRSRTLSFSHDFTVPVKLIVAAAAQGSLDDDGDHRHVSKRSRLSPSTSSSLSPFQQWSSGDNEFSAASSPYNPLDEPSPLGLRLRKSPSLLELIQMRLSHSNALPVAAVPSENANIGNNMDVKGNAISNASDKLKASNFIAASLRIGCWEFISRHEGDLVAKCYFAKKKLVWEVLEGGLKSKIEIQWSDIIGLKANCSDNCPGSLTIVLARQPLFFKESNPQPRKHTLWQASSDFTEGQASMHRQHFLQCPPGILNKHFEKLIQSDPRLNVLNQHHEFAMDSPYFGSQASVIENTDERNCIQLCNGEVSPISCFPDGASPSISELSSWNHEPFDTHSASLSKEAPSPISVMDANAIEGSSSNSNQSDTRTLKNLEQYKVGGLRPSMSMTDLVNHIGHQISERVTSGNIPSDKASECQDMLDNVAQMLLSDTQNIAASDEKLMKKVNSLCCLLQDPVSSENAPITGTNGEGLVWEMKGNYDNNSDGHSCKRSPSNFIPRRDSFGDLLLHLPRIASIPKFLFNIAEASENQFR